MTAPAGALGSTAWVIADGHIPAVPAQRTLQLRVNDLREPEPIPLATEYAAVVHSDVPVVVEHTRLDSRQAENALVSTIAYLASRS